MDELYFRVKISVRSINFTIFADSGNESGKRGKPPLWNPKFQKKKRSKLSQYTPSSSPIENLITELHEASRFERLQGGFVDSEAGDSVDSYGEPKYDELFIYEKCNLVSPNEIGMGAMLYTPTVSLQISKGCEHETKPGIYAGGVLADCDCASSCLLFDVPIQCTGSI